MLDHPGSQPDRLGHVARRHQLGISDWSAHVADQIAYVSTTRSNVLISGPRGTGKKFIARQIHQQALREQALREEALGSRQATSQHEVSRRLVARAANEPGQQSPRLFVPLSCELLPSPLFESQLFGHARGALVSPSAASIGALRVAHGGTLLLDSPGALDLVSQERLLIALRNGAYIPVGSSEPATFDVRFISTSSADLRQLVDEGLFLQELYEELAQLTIITVGLQDRVEDIGILAEHFLSERSHTDECERRHFSGDALRWLQAYSWPGNVGELKTLVEHLPAGTDEVGLDAVLGATGVLTARPYVRKMLRRYVGFSGLRALEVHACQLDHPRSSRCK
jgi:DNA-binding NtrC family response regulator